MLSSLYAQLLADGKQSNGGGGLSARSVRYVHTILHRGPGRGPVGSCQPQRRGRCRPTSSVCNSTADHDDLDR
jgi:hypothetical protein